MPNAKDFINLAINQNPNIANNPENRNLIDMIRTGKGEQYANNLCKSLGMSPQEATGQATQFLRGKFPNLSF